jgi:nucleoside-diphosphate-sugar epimerase
MKILVTGATGFIGSAIVQELLCAGHHVIGLARSDASAQSLKAKGVEVHRGDLENFESLRAGATLADAVIHTAFVHDFSDYQKICEIDRRAIEALGSALVGTHKPIIVTSGTALLPTGQLSTEASVPVVGKSLPRIASEEAAQSLAARGVRVAVLRLPPSVHGDGDHGFVPMIINVAREKGVSAYIGNGLNRWPAVHVLDAAHLYRLMIEKEVIGTFHGVGDEGVTIKELAEVIGRRLKIPVVSKTTEEATEHFSWMSHFLSLDSPASSAQTQQKLNWKPTHAGLIADVDRENYFRK